jgi:hypothetical protein
VLDEPAGVLGGNLYLAHHSHDALGGIVENLCSLFGGCLSDKMLRAEEDNSDGNHKNDHSEG